MSGESGGVIDGIALVAGLPIVLAGTAAMAAAAGAVKLGQTAVRAGIRHHRATKIKLEGFSSELSETWAQLNDVLEKQKHQTELYNASVQRQLTVLAEDMQTAVDTGSSDVEAKLEELRARTADALGASLTREEQRIAREAKQESAVLIKELDQALQARMQAADWQEKTGAARQLAEKTAAELVQDARASVDMLRAAAEQAEGDRAFRERVKVLEKSYDRAADALASGTFELAAGAAQKIIDDSAALVLEHEAQQAERAAISTILEARLSGLISELTAAEKIQFDDDLFGPVEESLSDFTESQTARLKEQAEGLFEKVRDDGTCMSIGALQVLLDRTEEQLIPQGEQIIREGHAKLLLFYEKLKVMNRIGSYLTDQGLVMDWASPMGEDVTRKIVAHFVEPVSGNALAVTLDGDAATADRLATDIFFYYGDGSAAPVSEKRKQQIRDGLTKALTGQGMDVSLGCKGSVNEPAPDKTLNSEAAVRAMAAEKVLAARQS